MVIEMPTKYVKDTFVGFVRPNDAYDANDANNANDDQTSFFETIIKELKEERKGIKERNCKERSLQEIFESVKEKLKDKLAIDKVDDFGAKPIYLFNGNGNDDERYF
jgi:hypothetical protein